MGKRARAMSKSARKAAVVKLNVGGRSFDTTEQTLSSAEYFRSLLSSRFAKAVDHKGRIFVDRCGDMFAIILNCLRNNSRPTPQVVSSKGRELCIECAFYGIDWLASKLQGLITPTDMRPQCRAIREQECRIREGIESESALVDVFKENILPSDPVELQVPLLLRGEAARPVVKGSFDNFRERLNMLTCNLLPQLEEIDDIVIAGSAVQHPRTDTQKKGL